MRYLVLVERSLLGTDGMNLPLSGSRTFGLAPNMENQLIVMHLDVESKPEVYHLHNDSIQIIQSDTVWILTGAIDCTNLFARS